MINCKFNIQPGSKKVIWAITNYCNYGCKYCIFASGKKEVLNELNTSECKDIVDDLNKNNFNYLKITGGEPFARTDLIEILTYIDNKNVKFDVSTNASYITEDIAQKLKTLKNLDFIHVSIDGANAAQHECVRGKDTYIPTIRGLSLLLQYNVPVRIGCVIHKDNENVLPEVIKSFKQLGIKRVAFSLMEPAGRLSEKNKLLATQNKNILQNIIENIKDYMLISHNLNDNKNYNQEQCPGGKTFLYITSNGMCSPCPWIAEHTQKYTIKTTGNMHILKSFNDRIRSCTQCPADNKISFINLVEQDGQV